MIKRLILFLMVVVGLAGLIVYSQVRPKQPRVSGIIEADEVRLGSRVGGRVARVHVAEGEQVAQGDLLIELEPFDLLEQENQAERTLAAREAEFQRLVNGLRSEEIAQAKARYDELAARLELLEAGPRQQEIDASKARLTAVEAERKLAKQLFDRHAGLVQTKAISAEEFERTSEEFAAAQALVVVRQKELEILELGAREEELRASRANVEHARQAWQMADAGFRQEEIDQAEASRDAAQAALDAIRRKKDELAITSPLAGRIDSLDLQPGDLVPASAPVVSLIDQRHLWLRAYVPQNRVGLRIGQTLQVTVDGLPEQTFQGTLGFISRQAEFTPSNVQTPEERSKQVFRVKVDLDDPHDLLRPGMTADLWLEPIGGAP